MRLLDNCLNLHLCVNIHMSNTTNQSNISFDSSSRFNAINKLQLKIHFKKTLKWLMIVPSFFLLLCTSCASEEGAMDTIQETNLSYPNNLIIQKTPQTIF